MNFQTCHGNKFQSLHGPSQLLKWSRALDKKINEHQGFVEILTELKIYSQILF